MKSNENKKIVCNTAVIIKETVGAFLALTFPQIFGIALSSATNIVVSAGSIVQESQETIVEMIKPTLIKIEPQLPTVA